MPQTNHGSIEWLRFPNPEYPGDKTKLIKKWLRDSWARRKIVALQQAVAGIVVPTKTSDLTNDSEFITGYTETDPTVPAWAKAATKPSYTASEVLTTAQFAAVNSGITAETLYPTTISSLTPYSGRCTISDGGYIKIGKIVFIGVTIESNQASGTTSSYLFTNTNADLVPISGRAVLSVLNETAKNTVTKAAVDKNGRIVVTNCATAQTLIFSGCYISA